MTQRIDVGKADRSEKLFEQMLDASQPPRKQAVGLFEEDKPSAVSAVSRSLHRGSSDTEAIEALQVLLTLLGFGPRQWQESGVNGVYGEDTIAAVAEFAKRTGGGEDGTRVTEPLARAILERYNAMKEGVGTLVEGLQEPALPFQEIVFGDGDAQRVHAIQALLLAAGHEVRADGAYRTDGDYGEMTRRAVEAYAKQRLLKIDGEKADGMKVTGQIADRLVGTLRSRLLEPRRPSPPQRPQVAIDGDPPEPLTLDELLDGLAAADEERPAAAKLVEALAAGEVGEPRSVAVDTEAIVARLLEMRPAGQKLENWCWAGCAEMIVGYLRSGPEVHCPTCGRHGCEPAELSQGQMANRMLGDPEVDCRLVPQGRASDAAYTACDCGALGPDFLEFDELAQSTSWGARRHLFEERGIRMVDGGPRVRVRGRLTDRQLVDLVERGGRAFRRRLDYEEEGCALSWEKLTELLDDERPVAFSTRFMTRGRGHMRVAAGYLETPDGGRFVAVFDPLPPTTGEIHWIPYGCYLDGPFGGHWRDYWVPRLGEGQTAETLRRKTMSYRVGRELTASYVEYDKTPSRQDDRESGHGLTDDDRTKALPEAECGLRAVQVLAEHAPGLAKRTWMGGNFVQLFGRELAAAFGFGDALDLYDLDPEPVAAEELALDTDHPVPIYDLLRSELEEWETDDPRDLLKRPTQLLWEVTRKNKEPFPFFSAVTVRRHGDDWRLASVGKAYLMSAIATRQLLLGVSDLNVLGSARGCVDFLQAIGLLQPLIQAAPEKDLRSEGALLGYTEAELDAFIEGGRVVQDLERLRVLATVRDLSAGEIRSAAAALELPLERVEGFLLLRDGGSSEDAAGRQTLAYEELQRIRQWLDEQSRDEEKKSCRVAKSIRYILNVRELYQLFVAYGDDELEPAYPQTFYKPNRRVSAGTQMEVMNNLRRLAKGLDTRAAVGDR